MKLRRIIALFAALLISFSLGNTAEAGGGKRLVLNVVGTALAVPTMIDTNGDGAGDLQADCFEVDLINGKRLQR